MILTNRVVGAAAGLLILSAAVMGCSSDDGTESRLRILVSNDDGVGAEGIDVLVQGLLANPNNVVVVSAPAENASGSGDSMIGDDTVPCTRGTGMAVASELASGYDTDVWAVDGCPADAVLYGLANLYPDGPPDVVITGINEGQNVGLTGTNGFISQISGTVGSAKAGACSGVPALASSQGDPPDGVDFDYQSGLAEVLDWLEANRDALLAGTVGVENITSINIPTCDTGTEIRGTVEVPLGTEIPEGVVGLLSEQDCSSDLEDPQDDLEAFFFGFVAVTPVPSNSSGTCDKID